MNSKGLEGLTGCTVTPKSLDSFTVFADLVVKWTRRINLVSRSSVDSVWTRHIADSAQLFRHVPGTARRFVDLGSGGGFPGLVIAILAQQERPDSRTILVESDQRKAAFLREAVRLTGVAAEVICARAEEVAPQGADVVSARALSPLPDLLAFVARHLADEGVAILPKGAAYQSELDAACVDWTFDAEVFPSQTDRAARILRLRHLTRRIGSTSPT